MRVWKFFPPIRITFRTIYDWKMIVNDTKTQLNEAQLQNDTQAVQVIIGSFLDLKKKLLHKGLI